MATPKTSAKLRCHTTTHTNTTIHSLKRPHRAEQCYRAHSVQKVRRIESSRLEYMSILSSLLIADPNRIRSRTQKDAQCFNYKLAPPICAVYVWNPWRPKWSPNICLFYPTHNPTRWNEITEATTEIPKAIRATETQPSSAWILGALHH